jgi:hypothetical protein
MYVQGALDDQPQDVVVHGLLVEIVGAHADGLDRVLAVELPRDHDHLGVRGSPQGLDQGEETLGDALRVRRQAQVLQHHGGLVPAQGRDRLAAGSGREHLVIVETPLELLLQPRVVLNDQQLGLAFRHRLSAHPGASQGPFVTRSPDNTRSSGLNL